MVLILSALYPHLLGLAVTVAPRASLAHAWRSVTGNGGGSAKNCCFQALGDLPCILWGLSVGVMQETFTMVWVQCSQFGHRAFPGQ